MTATDQPRPIRRRQALSGAAAIGIGGPLLAACSGDADTATDPTTTATGSETSDSPAPGDSEAPAADALASTGDIPEGGGAIFADEKVVITQPSAGEFKAFSAVCTHQGCVVSDVTDTINCACHGSSFSLADGSVVTGPATAALGEESITVDGDAITLG